MYQLDTQAARAADNRSSFIDTTGKYVGKFTKAEDITANSGTKGIAFDFVTNDGQKARFALYTLKTDGTQIYGFKQLMSILTVLKLRSIPEPELIEATVWDRQAGQEVKKPVPQFRDLLGKEIGLLFEMEEYEKRDGGTAWRPSLAGAFQANSELTASEVLDQKVQPLQLAKMVSALKDRPIRVKASSTSEGNRAAAESAWDDDSDSIPF